MMNNQLSKKKSRKFSLLIRKWLKFLVIFCSVAILVLFRAEVSYSKNPSSSKCPLPQQGGAIEQELSIQKLNPDPNNPNEWISVSEGPITIPGRESIIVAKPSIPENYTISHACFERQDVKIQLIQGDAKHIRLVIPSPPFAFPENFFGKEGNLYLVAEPLTIHTSSNGVQYGKNVDLTLSDTSQSVTWQATPPIGTFNPTTSSAKTTFTAPTEDQAKDTKAITITATASNVKTTPITIQLSKEFPASPNISPITELPKVFVRQNVYVSNRTTAKIITLLAVGISYLVIGLARFTFFHPGKSKENKTRISNRPLIGSIADFLANLHYLNPLEITSSTFGRASLSKFQLLGFTFVVIGLSVYLLILTGNLSDLSSDVLVLLGVSAAGTVGTGAVQIVNKRLSFENWAWVRHQGWLTVGEKGCAETAKPEKHSSWKDLILDEDGTLNVYKFQLALTSLLVAAFLILSGGNNLGGFVMPKGFPELLGLSNIFYVLGRAVEPQSFSELNTTLEGLRKLDDELHQEQKEKPASNLKDLGKYKEYIKKAQSAALMLKTLFSDLDGTKFDNDTQPIPEYDLLPYWAKNVDPNSNVTVPPNPLPTIIAPPNPVKYSKEIKFTLSDSTQPVTWTTDPLIGTLNPKDPSVEVTYLLTENEAGGAKEVTIKAEKDGQNLNSITIQFEP
jgi:hypothetical protein